MTNSTMACMPSTTEQPFFGHLLMGVNRNWRHLVQLRLEELGLTDATWAPLFHLQAAGKALSLKQLAHRVGLDSSSLVRVIDLLEARGWLRRETDSVDRRSKALILTAEGHAVVVDVRAKLQHVENQLLQGLEDSTIDAMRQGLQQLNQRLMALQVADKESE